MESKRRKKLFSAIAITMTMSFMYTGSAYAKAFVQDWHLVDSGKHLDYGVKSKYKTDIADAVPIWNNYKSGVIRKDTASTIEDVTIIDVYKQNNQAGSTTAGGEIRLNTYNLDTDEFSHVVNTVAHEFGHALGLDHHSTSTSDIMYIAQTDTEKLSQNDKDSYDEAYKSY